MNVIKREIERKSLAKFRGNHVLQTRTGTRRRERKEERGRRQRRKEERRGGQGARVGGRGGKIRGVGRGAEREREREEHPAARPLHSTHRSPLQPALTRRPCSRIELELAIDSQVFCGADNARFNRLPLRLRDWASTRSRRPSPTSFTRLSLSLSPPLSSAAYFPDLPLFDLDRI